jgi:Leucine-rich repeat (LRR) protein
LPVHRLFTKKTVDALVEYAKLDWNTLGSDPCKQADISLNELEYLDLTQKGLKTIEPVGSLKKLKTLIVRHNSLESLLGVEKLGSFGLWQKQSKNLESHGEFEELKRSGCLRQSRA